MTMPGTPKIGRIGIWSMELRFGDHVETSETAAELDELGYGALWIPGATGGDLLDDLSRLLTATRDTTIASGILNIWKHDPKDVAAWWHAMADDRRDRFLLGLGVSHGEAMEKPMPSH